MVSLKLETNTRITNAEKVKIPHNSGEKKKKKKTKVLEQFKLTYYQCCHNYQLRDF